MVITRRPAAEAVSSDSATEIQRDATLLEEFQQAAQVLDTAREPVELGNDHRFDFAALHPRDQTLQAGTVQVLGRFPAVDDDLE